MTTAPKRPGYRARMRETAASRRSLAALLRHAGRPLLLATLVCEVALGLLPVVFALATSAVLGHVPDAVASGDDPAAWRGAAAALTVASLAFAAQQVLVPVQYGLGELMARRIDGRVLDQLMAASLRPASVAPLADERLLDLLGRAQRELDGGFQSPGKGCAGLLHLIARFLQLAGFTAVVGVYFSVPGAVGLLAVVLAFRHGQRDGLHRYSNLYRANAAERRESDYLRDLATGSTAAKEIRVFALADWFTERYRRTYLGWLMPAWRERRRIMLRPFYWYTAAGVLVVSAVMGAIGASGADTLAAARVALLIQAVMGALRLAEHYPEADLQTEYGADAYDAVRAFERGMADEADGTAPGAAGAASAAAPAPLPRSEIAFRSVTFRYPGTGKPVFEDLDLVLPVGRCTAIVGVNGAGKSTLVKLLARLYEPERGAVTVDGFDIREFSVDAWRGRLAIVFQNFIRHERSAHDNIALGAAPHRADAEAVRSAALSAGALPGIEALPSGMATPLSAHMTGGSDLSGGQWQRVALARALFRLEHGGEVLVLDEPTASLDVRAEAGFFEEFMRLAAGRTSLLISHRFSTVRHADHIIVLADGRVAEQGTHDELLRRGGRYAELFHLQADRFTDKALAAEPGESEVVA